MARTVLDVFLSSTAADLKPYRDAVHARLAKIEFFHCVRQEYFGPQDAQALAYCREKAAQADLFVGLVGMRRGWEPDGDNARRSITEIEHDAAKDAGRRRYLWVTPTAFAVPGDLYEPRAKHNRQLAFRNRVMAGGERIVAQTGFDSPAALAAEIVERLFVQVVTGDLITLLRPEFAQRDGGAAEDQAPAVAAAVEKLAADDDIDLLALATNPKGIDLAELETKLKDRADTLEALGQPKIDAGRRDIKASAEYWRHIGALAFLHDTQKALTAYRKAVELDPDSADGWTHLGQLQFRIGEFSAATRSSAALVELGLRTKDPRAEAAGSMLMGRVHNIQGDFGKAEDMHLMALTLHEELDDKAGLAADYGNLGNIHQTRGDLGKAEEMHLKSLTLNEELGRKEGMTAAYGNLGVIHQTAATSARPRRCTSSRSRSTRNWAARRAWP